MMRDAILPGRGSRADARAHRRQPLLARPLHRARGLYRPHPRRYGASRRAPARLWRHRQRMGERARNRPTSIDAFKASHDTIDEASVVRYLVFAPDNPSSIYNCIEYARSNARSVRTALTIEAWEAINTAWLELKKFEKSRSVKNRVDSMELRRFPGFREEGRARFRRLVAAHHAAHRRILVHAARPLYREGRQHRAHPRREISCAAAGIRNGRRPARLFPVDGDPALGVGADRLSLGLPRRA